MKKILIDFLLSTKKSYRIAKNIYSTNYSKNLLISININNFIRKKNRAYQLFGISHNLRDFQRLAI